MAALLAVTSLPAGPRKIDLCQVLRSLRTLPLGPLFFGRPVFLSHEGQKLAFLSLSSRSGEHGTRRPSAALRQEGQ